MRNQKEFSLLNDAQKSALGSVGTQVSGALQNGIQGMMTQYPQLAQNPQFKALVQSLGNIDIATPLNGLGQFCTVELSAPTHAICMPER